MGPIWQPITASAELLVNMPIKKLSHFGFNIEPYIEGEIWKDLALDGFEGLYQVSNLGRIKSLDRKHGYYSRKGKILSQNVKAGYLNVSLSAYRPQLRKRSLVHRLVASAFIPNPQNKPVVNHIDFDGLNNRIENLEWCTTSENMRHNSNNELGRRVQGQKLTYRDAVEIRCLYALGEGGYTLRELAKMYDVNCKTIYSIISFQRWKFYDN